MSLNFIDLDWFIEERFHKTVQQLFLERGEDGFYHVNSTLVRAYWQVGKYIVEYEQQGTGRAGYGLSLIHI